MKKRNCIISIIYVGLISLYLCSINGCADLNQANDDEGIYKNNPMHHGSCDISTIRRGKWSRTRIWDLKRLPKANERACVNHRVTYDQNANQAVDLRSVVINDSLIFITNQSTQLRVQDLYVMENGLLRIGQADNPLPARYTADIVFVHQEFEQNSNSHSPHNLGLMTMGGNVEFYGRKVDRILRLGINWTQNKAQYSGNQTQAIFEQMNQASWRVNDEILFPATTFKRNEELGNETRFLEELSPQLIKLDQALNHTHKRIYRKKLYLANLSTNIILRSAQPDEIKHRGHVMFMKGAKGKCGQVKIDGVRFDHLGRTDKQLITSRRNPQMMYALHFHRCDAPPEEKSHLVQNSVVVNTPGWGLVNHGSDVIFRNNVVYDFRGAGFVTEAGNERGEFIGNLAVGGQGKDGPKTYGFRRLYLNEEDRLKQADLGFHGDGFWMSSPFVKVENNASIGNHGNGFIWYITGIDARFVNTNGNRRPLSLTVPASFMKQAELDMIGYRQPRRFWKAEESQFLLADLPIFQPIKNNYAAANFIGLKTRYARSLNKSFLSKFWGTDLVNRSIGGIDHIRDRAELYIPYSLFTNNILQNNEIGLHATYSVNIRFKDFIIEADEQLQSTPDGASEFMQNETTGIELNHHSNGGNILDDILVRGYEIGERRSANQGGRVKERDVNYIDCIEDHITWSEGDIKRNRR